MSTESRRLVALNLGEAAARVPRKIADADPVKGKSAGEMRAEQAAWRDQQPIRESCLFCDWSWIGLVADGRIAAREHREQHHPEATLKKPRRLGRITKSWERTPEESERASLEAAEMNRIRAEREDSERLEKVLRARARDAA